MLIVPIIYVQGATKWFIIPRDISAGNIQMCH